MTSSTPTKSRLSGKRYRSALFCAALLGASSPALATNFCAVTSSGAQCLYHDMAACQQGLIGMGGGQCVVNPASLPAPRAPYQPPAPLYRLPAAPQAQRPNIMGDYYRVAEEGRRERQEREEHEAHEARMRLMQAQTEAATRQPTAQPQRHPLAGMRVKFLCEDAQGQLFESYVVAVGCIVAAIEPVP